MRVLTYKALLAPALIVLDFGTIAFYQLQDDQTLIERIIGLGLGAVIAVIVLNWKRIDDKAQAVLLKDLNERHQMQIAQLTDRVMILAETVPTALREIKGVLEGMTGMVNLERQLREIEDRLPKIRNKGN